MMRLLTFLLVVGVLMMAAGCTSEDTAGKNLTNSDPQVRIQAAEKLGEIGTYKAMMLLENAKTKEQDYVVRDAITKAMAKIKKQPMYK